MFKYVYLSSDHKPIPFLHSILKKIMSSKTTLQLQNSLKQLGVTSEEKFKLKFEM